MSLREKISFKNTNPLPSQAVDKTHAIKLLVVTQRFKRDPKSQQVAQTIINKVMTNQAQSFLIVHGEHGVLVQVHHSL